MVATGSGRLLAPPLTRQLGQARGRTLFAIIMHPLPWLAPSRGRSPAHSGSVRSTVIQHHVADSMRNANCMAAQCLSLEVDITAQLRKNLAVKGTKCPLQGHNNSQGTAPTITLSSGLSPTITATLKIQARIVRRLIAGCSRRIYFDFFAQISKTKTNAEPDHANFNKVWMDCSQMPCHRNLSQGMWLLKLLPWKIRSLV